jgi:5'-nucleotidase
MEHIHLSSRRPIFAVDCDGVLANLHQPWYDLHNEHCNICQEPLTIDKVKSWDTHEYVACGKQIYLYLKNQELWRNLPVIPLAQPILQQLAEIVRPVVVTSVTFGERARFYRIEWIRRHFPFLDPGDIVIATKKECVKYDIILDDNPENLTLHSAYRLVLNYPWNSNFSDAIRVFDWEDVYYCIQQYVR